MEREAAVANSFSSPKLTRQLPLPPTDQKDVLTYLQNQYKELNRLFQMLDQLLGQQGAGSAHGMLPFFNSASGFVLKGRDRGLYYRLLIDDSEFDPNDPNTTPISGVEQVTSFQQGDVVFFNAKAGPVITSSSNRSQFRFLVRDNQVDAPIFGIEPVTPSSLLADDYIFSKGASWLNVGRTNGNFFLWLVGVEDAVGFARFVLP